MASLTIKNVPDLLLARLRQRATAEKRSMNKEVIRLLERSLSEDRMHPLQMRRAMAETQVEAWSRLGGRWISNVPVQDEVADIYAARSGGREIEL